MAKKAQPQAPTTVSEMVIDPIYREKLKTIIFDIVRERICRPQAKAGFHYVRDWYDRMKENGQLNVNFIADNIPTIEQKKSNLPSQIRNVITAVHNSAAEQTIFHYESIVLIPKRKSRAKPEKHVEL